MARKVRPQIATDTWMTSYTDMVTLLMCFFILLYSMSTPNAEKWEQFMLALSRSGVSLEQVEEDETGQAEDEAPPEELDPDMLPASFDQLYDYLKNHVKQNNMGGMVELTRGENVVYIRFHNNVFFNPDEAALRPESHTVLDFLGDCLKNVEDEIFVININGHTAAVPNVEDYQVSDWNLSGERATNIAIYLEEMKQVDPLKMRPAGFGKNYPVAENNTPAGRQRNRRVDMVVVSNAIHNEPDNEIAMALAGLFDPSRFPQEGGVRDLLIPDPTQETLGDLGMIS